MEFCGIICELNPPTNGHAYFIDEAKKKSKLNPLLLMSGNFVQRGEPAILDKFKRAEIAVNLGAFAVLELPTAFATAPAEKFALGAVKALNSLGCVTKLAFGCETGDIAPLQAIAEFAINPTPLFKRNLKERLNQGENYHFAYVSELKSALPELNIDEIFSGANNILAIEYIKAIKILNSKIEPIAIKRVDNGFNSSNSLGKFLSASGVRELKLGGKDYSSFVPPLSASALDKFSFDFDAFKRLELYNLRTTDKTKLKACFDFNEGIENLLSANAKTSATFDEFVDLSVTKRYREAKIKRLALYPLFNLTKSKFNKVLKEAPVLKLLAIKKSNKNKLSELMKGQAKIIVTSTDCKLNQHSVSLDLDLKASNLYYAFSNFAHNYDLTKQPFVD